METIEIEFIDDESIYKCKTFNMEIPEFTDKLIYFKTNKLILTKESQVIKFLDNMDKSNFMDDNQISIIINYRLYKKTSKVDKEDNLFILLKELASKFENKEQLYFDFISVASHLEHLIKDLTVEKQLSLIVESTYIGYKSNVVLLQGLEKQIDKLKIKLSSMKGVNERLRYLHSLKDKDMKILE